MDFRPWGYDHHILADFTDDGTDVHGYALRAQHSLGLAFRYFTDVRIGSNLTFVKTGAGKLTVSTTAKQTYTGMTEICDGTLRTTVNGVDYEPFGHATVENLRDIDVMSGATFEIANSWYTIYRLVLHGGTVVFDYDNNNSGGYHGCIFGATRLLDDSYFVAKTGARPHFWSTHTLDLGGHVLDVTMASGVTFDLGGVGAVGSTITNGTIRVSGGTLHTDKFKNIAMNAKTVNLQVSCALNIESIRALDIGDYEALYTGTSNAGTGALNVYRTFKPVSTNFYGPTMQDGSTMDLRAWPESAGWPLASGFKTGATNVQFAADSTVNVNLAGRSDLMALAKSNEPYVVTWDSAPSDVAFTLDAETAMLGFKLRPRAEGLRLERLKGIVVIVK